MRSFLDNFIPLHTRLNGEQYAGWKPSKVADSGLGCRLLADEMIPMQDGVCLSADVYTPKKTGRYPAVVQFAAYSRELHTMGVPTGTNEIGAPPITTDRGYAQVVVCRRGMGRSQGKPGCFFNPQDVDDHVRCVEWAANQPWCDGNVVLFGTSYYGMTQVQVATRRPAGLKAFFCNEICTDYFRHLIRFGGTFNLNFLSLWLGANFRESQIKMHVPPVMRALLSWVVNRKFLWDKVARPRINKLMQGFIENTPVKEAREWFASWMLDHTVRDPAVFPKGPSDDLGEIEIPFVVVQNLGYLNLHNFGTYDLYQNSKTPEDRKWMILGPAEYELPVYSWQLEALAFFDYIIKGVENGYAEQARVRYWVEGRNAFASTRSFPVPSARPTQLYLTKKEKADAPGALLTIVPARTEETWAAIPMGAKLVHGLDEVMNETLSYEYLCARDTEIAGPATLNLRFSCNEIDSYVVARLGRVDLDDRFHLLALTAISPARRRVDQARSNACEIAIDTEKPEPLTPGEPVTLRTSFTPFATSLRKGERLRLDLGSRTDLLRGTQRDGFVHFDLQVPPYFSRNTAHLGAETFVEVAVVSEPG